MTHDRSKPYSLRATRLLAFLPALFAVSACGDSTVPFASPPLRAAVVQPGALVASAALECSGGPLDVVLNFDFEQNCPCSCNSAEPEWIDGWSTDGHVDWWHVASATNPDNCAVDLSGSSAGRLASSIFTTTAGTAYRVDFDVSANNNSTSGPKSFAVSVVTTAGLTLVTRTITANDAEWASRSITFDGDGDDVELVFQSLEPSNEGAYLDNVRVSTPPARSPAELDVVQNFDFEQSCPVNAIEPATIDGWTTDGHVDWWREPSDENPDNCAVDLSGWSAGRLTAPSFATLTGVTYRVEFDVKPNGYADADNPKAFTISAVSASNQTISTRTINAIGSEWKARSWTFQGNGGPVKLVFQSLEPSNQGAYIDNVRVSALSPTVTGVDRAREAFLAAYSDVVDLGTQEFAAVGPQAMAQGVVTWKVQRRQMGAVSMKSFEGLDASGARVFAGDLAIDFAKVSALTEADLTIPVAPANPGAAWIKATNVLLSVTPLFQAAGGCDPSALLGEVGKAAELSPVTPPVAPAWAGFGQGASYIHAPGASGTNSLLCSPTANPEQATLTLLEWECTAEHDAWWALIWDVVADGGTWAELIGAATGTVTCAPALVALPASLGFLVTPAAIPCWAALGAGAALAGKVGALMSNLVAAQIAIACCEGKSVPGLNKCTCPERVVLAAAGGVPGSAALVTRTTGPNADGGHPFYTCQYTGCASGLTDNLMTPELDCGCNGSLVATHTFAPAGSNQCTGNAVCCEPNAKFTADGTCCVPGADLTPAGACCDGATPEYSGGACRAACATKKHDKDGTCCNSGQVRVDSTGADPGEGAGLCCYPGMRLLPGSNTCVCNPNDANACHSNNACIVGTCDPTGVKGNAGCSFTPVVVPAGCSCDAVNGLSCGTGSTGAGGAPSSGAIAGSGAGGAPSSGTGTGTGTGSGGAPSSGASGTTSAGSGGICTPASPKIDPVTGITVIGADQIAALGWPVADNYKPYDIPLYGLPPGWCPSPSYILGLNSVSGSYCANNNAPGCIVNNGYPMQGSANKVVCVPPSAQFVHTGYGLTTAAADVPCPAPANVRITIAQGCMPNDVGCEQPGYPGCGPAAATKACEWWNTRPPNAYCFNLTTPPPPCMP